MNQKTTENFIHLLSLNHHRIYAFIQNLVVNNSDAEDIMQETSTIMWKKFDDFRPGSDFVAWGVTIAKYRIFEYRKQNKQKLMFSEETLAVLESRSLEMVPELDMRINALRKCIQKLSENDRKLLQMKYKFNLAGKSIAQRIGSSIHMVYRHTSRIKYLLVNCVRQKLKYQDNHGSL